MKIGDTIEIPRGTLFVTTTFYSDISTTTRKSTARVAQLPSMEWHDFMGVDVCNQLMEIMYTRMRSGQLPPNTVTPTTISTRNAHTFDLPEVRAEEQRIRDLFDNDFDMVVYGDRMARASQVIVVEPKVQKDAEVTDLKKMRVKGSVWRFTRDVTIMAERYPWDDSRLKEVNDALIASGNKWGQQETFCLPIFTIRANTVIETLGKTVTIHRQNQAGIPVKFSPESIVDYLVKYPFPHSGLDRTLPQYQQMGENPYHKDSALGLFQSDIPEMALPYGQIADAIELIKLPSDRKFVLRDRDTGKFFAGFDYDYATGDHYVKMVDVFTKAKKYASSANAKASVKDFTGQYRGQKSSSTDWSGSEKKFDLPPSWELVEMDGVTKKVYGTTTIEDWV